MTMRVLERLRKRQTEPADSGCLEEVSMTRDHQRRIDRALKIAVSLDNAAGIRPSTEWQVRPMTGLSHEQKQAAWKLAVEVSKGRQPTRDMVAYAAWHVRQIDSQQKRPSRWRDLGRRLLGR